jgi:hypothetical protein
MLFFKANVSVSPIPRISQEFDHRKSCDSYSLVHHDCEQSITGTGMQLRKR